MARAAEAKRSRPFCLGFPPHSLPDTVEVALLPRASGLRTENQGRYLFPALGKALSAALGEQVEEILRKGVSDRDGSTPSVLGRRELPPDPAAPYGYPVFRKVNILPGQRKEFPSPRTQRTAPTRSG